MIVDVIADKKGEDIFLLDVRERTIIADYFVIGTAGSDRQIKAISEAVRQEAKAKLGVYARGTEGQPESGWVLLDFADVIVHLFQADVRRHYDLETLWAGAPVLLKMQ